MFALQAAWAAALVLGRPLRDGPRRAPGGGAGWLRSWRRSACGATWSARAIRADWQYRTSFFLFLLSQTVVACMDLAVVASIFSQVDSLAGLVGRGGGAAVRPERGAVRAGRHDDQPGGDRVPPHQGGHLRPVPAAPAAGAAPPVRHRVRAPAPGPRPPAARRPRRWPSCSRRSTGASRPCVLVVGHADQRHAHLRLGLGGDVVDLLLDGREPGGRQRLHLRRARSPPATRSTSSPRWMRRLLTFLIPLAFVAYFPAARLLGREDPARPARAPSRGPRRSSPLASVLVARAVWALAVRHHRSTGS